MKLKFRILIPVVSALVPLLWLAAMCIGCPPVFGWWTAAIIAGAVAAFPVSVVLHELGHMLFGACVKIMAVPKFKIFGSSCCKIIPMTDKNLKGRIIFTAFGGLAVNFVLFAAGVVLLCVSREYWYASIFIPACWYLIIINAFPVTYGSGKTDGLIIEELSANEDTAQVMLAVLTVQARILNGQPIEEAGKEILFNLPQIREDDVNFIALTELRYEYFKAVGDEATAEKYLNRFEQLEREYLY